MDQNDQAFATDNGTFKIIENLKGLAEDAKAFNNMIGKVRTVQQSVSEIYGSIHEEMKALESEGKGLLRQVQEARKRQAETADRFKTTTNQT